MYCRKDHDNINSHARNKSGITSQKQNWKIALQVQLFITVFVYMYRNHSRLMTKIKSLQYCYVHTI